MTIAVQEHVAEEREWSPAQPWARQASNDSWAPEGLLALLVTDLEGFTTLIERLGDEPGCRVMRSHNALLRASIRGHSGREIAHTGDGFIVAFRSIRNALGAACEMQDALERQTLAQPDVPLRARIGVHVGEPLREDGRLIGTCVNTAVRVCGRARAGSVLVTEITKALATGLLFPFEPGGRVELKGLSQAVDVYELQWRSVRQHPLERC